MQRKGEIWLICLLLIGTCAGQQLSCKVTEIINCVQDNVNGQRLLGFAAVYGAPTTNSLLTRELCAAMCMRQNYTIMGVEFAYQCFCGNSFNYKPVELPMSQCNMPCSNNQNETCGGTDAMLLFYAECTGVAAPSGYACLDQASKELPFCDHTLNVTERVTDLVSRLTLDEKLGIIGPDQNDTNVNTCNCMTGGVERLGIPNYMQLVEVNSAVASTCFAPEQCATEFPGPTGLAASFNRSVWNLKGAAISDEMRAFNNLNWYRTFSLPFSYIGLTGFGPNINIVRDPRFGRNSELPSEDPFLSGSYATEYVRGMQEGDDPRYLKMITGLKHYAAYSVEANRAGFIPNISTFDLWDTYLAQFEMAFTEGGASGAMCSYAGVNGVPSCASDFLLNEVVRDIWGRWDAFIATDCGAIGNMIFANHYASNNTDAAAKTINGGSDLNLGDNFFPPVIDGGNGALPEALSIGTVNETRVDEAVARLLAKRFLAGQFDPLEGQIYTQIGPEVINSSYHVQLTLEAALQSFVLLKNDGNILPFAEGKQLAVVGPHVHSTRDLMEDYISDQVCFGGGYDCVPTIGDMFTALHGANATVVAQGVDLDSTNSTGIPAALAAVKAADYVVLCIGLGNEQEHEGIDRTNITLPGLQESFALDVLALGKPTVVVLINGGIVAIDNLIAPAHAIIEAFYPSMAGAQALYQTIFGYENRWGKLPVTIYPTSFISQQSMTDFDMTSYPGRTYRYYSETPLYPFGWGLSYTQFSIDCSGESSNYFTNATVVIENTGKVGGDEVVMVFHRVSDEIRNSTDHPVPIRSLVDFTRVTLPSGGYTKTEFSIPWDRLALTDNNGDKVLYRGTHYLDFTDSVAPTCTLKVLVQ